MKYNGTEIKGKVLTVRVDIGSSSDSYYNFVHKGVPRPMQGEFKRGEPLLKSLLTSPTTSTGKI